ncbi:MAG: MMPL family transporter [Deltaproteobacteria bacterium]|nr:MMPL family transporter [Deltaproteobacteria bacterium]
MKALARFILRYRLWVMLGVLAITAFFGFSIRNIKVQTDMLASLPEDDSDVIAFKDIGKRYGGNYIAMVAIEAEEGDPLGVFSRENLSLLRRLTRAIAKTDGVRQVNSLTNILDIKKTDSGLEVGKLLPRDKIPADPARLKALRDYTLSKSMYKDNLVSADARYTVVVARLQPGVNKQVVAAAIKKTSRQVAGTRKLYFGGLPMVMDYMNQVIYHDMSALIPLVSIIILITLYLSFRTLTGVLLPLVTVFLSVVWVLGLMALTGAPISMVSAIMPVVLIACGTAYGIHVINKYYEDNSGIRSNGPDEYGVMEATLSEVGVPLVMAALTTFIGFASLLSADLSIIRDFGVYTSLGIIAALVLSLTFVPAVLSLKRFGNRHKKTDKGEGGSSKPGLLSRFTAALGPLSLEHRKLIILLALVFTGASIALLPRIKTEVNMTTYFEKKSEPRVAQELMEHHFGGATPVLVKVQGDMKDPAVVKLMRLLEQELDAMPHVHNAQSIAYLVAEMNRTMNNRFVVPAGRKGLGNLWVFIDGNDILEQMVNTDMTEAIVQAKVDREDTAVFKDIALRVSGLAGRFEQPRFKLPASSVPPGKQKDFARVLAGHVGHRIWLDLSASEKDPPAEDRLVVMVESAMKIASLPDKKVDQKVISMIADYLGGDEAEIELAGKAVETASREMTRLVREKNLTRKNIEKVLKAVMSVSDYDSKKDYEEDLSYVPQMASSLVTLAREVVSKEHINKMYKALEPLVEAAGKKDPDLGSKVRADLWETQEPVLYLTATEYERVTGTKPDKKSAVTISVRETDLPLIAGELDSRLKRSQLNSLGLALVLVLVLMMIQLRSLVGGLVSMIPIVLTVVLNFGVMCALGVPLDNATMMVASVAIGIGIDYTIHFTSRFRSEFKRADGDLGTALSVTLSTTGRAIVINSATVLLGFLVLMFSRTAPIQRFGWLTASTMLYSSLAAMILVPSVAFATGAKYLQKWNGSSGSTPPGGNKPASREKNGGKNPST